MMRYLAIMATAVLLQVTPAAVRAQSQEELDTLFAALGLPEMIEIMREEGLAYGDDLAAEMLPGGPSPDWGMAVSVIYDAQMMYEEVRGAFDEALAGEDVAAMTAFFTSDLGRQIVELEVSARRALLDDAVEEAAYEHAALSAADETPRYLLVEEFIGTNGLIDSNVEGALNASYAFYMGLIDGGAMPIGVTAETALQDVWARESEIRMNTAEWAYAFLLMAYAPLSDEDLRAYIAFSATEAGEALNDALFLAFNGTFDDISRALGLASARFMQSQEL